ncbi:MAG: alpha-galactosidase [Clostridia bacterium]|nr:alpha-galactosidase [Clostridia bacterium]
MEFLTKQIANFSFLYDGKDWKEYAPVVVSRTEGDQTVTEYRFADGLKVTNTATCYTDFGAWEWVNTWENTADEPTKILSELWDCDCELPMPHAEKRVPSPWTPVPSETTVIYHPNGSTTCDEFDFFTHVDDSVKRTSFLFPGKTSKLYHCGGGRSSHGNAPFFHVHHGGRGYFVAIGWTGQWNGRFSRTEDSLRVQSKIEDTHFYLKPKETIRTSSVLILPYEGTVEDSFNIWRRFLRKHFAPTLERFGRLPFCTAFWGGSESGQMIRRVEALDRARLPVDTVWIDAGWCGADTQASDNEFSGDWAQHVGDWVVSPLVHPNGLEDVADAIHKSGRRMVLWFEPERVRAQTPLALEHPDWILSDGVDQKGLLLNLGNEEAFDYIADFLCGMAERLQLDCYRQDFNMEPLSYWRANDEENRRGLTEIKHIMGLYRLWDRLLERFPNLIIDNCASGGKRLDIETTRRSFPLWRSDAQCPGDPIPEITQANHMNFSLWLPLTGSGSGRLYDTYAMRSAYGPGMTTNYLYSAEEHFGEDPKQEEWFRERGREYLAVRPYFDGDVYHLTKATRDDTAWCAIQWNRPEEGDGLVQVFKRADSPYTHASFSLRKIDETRNYRITDLDGGEWLISGEKLTREGFSLILTEQRVAKLYRYEVI